MDECTRKLNDFNFRLKRDLERARDLWWVDAEPPTKKPTPAPRIKRHEHNTRLAMNTYKSAMERTDYGF